MGIIFFILFINLEYGIGFLILIYIGYVIGY